MIPTQWKKLAECAELEIELKENVLSGSDHNIIKTLNERYHLDTYLLDEESESYENLYYNFNERSLCGFIYEFPDVLILWPKYYVPGFEDYFKQLIRDSEKITINRR